jgi:hypothetical protein
MIIPSHVQRKSNILANRLTNEGVDLENQDMVFPWSGTIPNQLQEDYHQLHIKENKLSNGCHTLGPGYPPHS